MYDMINAGLSKGVFLLQSPAQLKMGQRLKARNLLDLAYQVALIRPGVGVQGSAVSQFVERYRHGAEWEYDHPVERRALAAGLRDNSLAGAGSTAHRGRSRDDCSGSRRGAPRLRQTQQREPDRYALGEVPRRRDDGTVCSEETAEKIFGKINGHYMFPESHSHAFAVTAYQAAWLKRYHPLEFSVGLMNNQPMGFYPMETLKQDARRFGVPFLEPLRERESGGVRA